MATQRSLPHLDYIDSLRDGLDEIRIKHATRHQMFDSSVLVSSVFHRTGDADHESLRIRKGRS